jgi:hypothetical protein
MPNNVNAQAIAFANNYARRVADDVVSCYLTLKRIKQVWDGQSVGTVIPNTADLIQDGATSAVGTADGRAPVTNAQINVLISNCVTLIAQFEANSNLILNQFQQVQVNAKSVVE